MAGSGVSYQKETAAGVITHVLTVDPQLATVKTALVDNTLGHAADGQVRVGRPALFTRVQAPDTSWTAYEINVPTQYGSILYTPTYGPSVTMTKPGSVMTVSGGTITGFQSVEEGFREARFTTAVSPRTAIGVNAAGKLVLVSTPAASIQQMRQLMLGLGCVDAFNLDGCTSCAMYYNGTYLAKPERELTVTLQVFPK